MKKANNIIRPKKITIKFKIFGITEKVLEVDLNQLDAYESFFKRQMIHNIIEKFSYTDKDGYRKLYEHEYLYLKETKKNILKRTNQAFDIKKNTKQP